MKECAREPELSDEVKHGSLLNNSGRLLQGKRPAEWKTLNSTWPVREVAVVKAAYLHSLQEERGGSDG